MKLKVALLPQLQFARASKAALANREAFAQTGVGAVLVVDSVTAYSSISGVATSPENAEAGQIPDHWLHAEPPVGPIEPRAYSSTLNPSRADGDSRCLGPQTARLHPPQH